MLKILNKFIYYVKNILLPILLIATIYIVMFMFKRLEKDIFGANLTEFLSVILPFILLLILLVINSILKQENVYNNLFYNITSFIIMITIFIFVYRALFDQNMYLWHKYGYNINFNYFADQIAPIKIMLYGLSFANVLLIIEGYLKKEKNKEIKENKKSE